MKPIDGHSWYRNSHYSCYAELAKELKFNRFSTVETIQKKIEKVAGGPIDALQLAKEIKHNYADLVLGCESDCHCACECVCDCDQLLDMRKELQFDKEPVANNAIFFSEISKLEEREQKRLWQQINLF